MAQSWADQVRASRHRRTPRNSQAGNSRSSGNCRTFHRQIRSLERGHWHSRSGSASRNREAGVRAPHLTRPAQMCLERSALPSRRPRAQRSAPHFQGQLPLGLPKPRPAPANLSSTNRAALGFSFCLLLRAGRHPVRQCCNPQSRGRARACTPLAAPEGCPYAAMAATQFVPEPPACCQSLQ